MDPPPRPDGVDDPTEAVAKAGLRKLRDGVYRSGPWPAPYVILGDVALMPHTVSIYAAVGHLFGWLCLLVTLYLLLVHGRNLRQKLFRYRGDKMTVPRPRGFRGKGRGGKAPQM